RRDFALPIEPELPAVGQAVGDLHVEDGGALPMPPPPRRRVEAPQLRRPPRAEVLRNVAELVDQPRAGDADEAAGLHESRERGQKEIVGAVVDERVDRDDRVEKLGREGERAGVEAERKDAAAGARGFDALPVLRWVEPQIGGPNAHAEFAMQEDRRERLAAAE